MKYQILLCSLIIAAATLANADEARSFKNESEAGNVITGGKTEVSTLSFKEGSTYTAGLDSVTFNARYLRSSNEGVEQALQWGLGLKYNHQFTEMFGWFLGQLVESNIYQKIFQRYATDVGAKQFFSRKENELIWFAEAGYRFTRENYFDSFKNLNFLRIYTEIEKFFAKTVSGKFWFEYLPNITEWKAYQFNASISMNASLSEVFSVKSGFDLRYNNEAPVGAKSSSDRIFTTSLVAKF
jgi:putative salt-induced outer membrane protein